MLEQDDGFSVIDAKGIISPPFFSGNFALHTSSGLVPEWLSLSREEGHPSRSMSSEHNIKNIYPSKSCTITLREGSNVIDILVTSCIQHGICIITLSPAWNICCQSLAFDSLKVAALCQFPSSNPDNSFSLYPVTSGNKEVFTPVLKWKVLPPSSDKGDELKPADDLVVAGVSSESNIITVSEEVPMDFCLF